MPITAISKKTRQLFLWLDKLEPLWWFGLRLWIAHIFFSSGLTKLDDFEVTVFLFENEYAVPVIPPYIAAYIATFFELVCPVAIVFGFLTRLAVIPLLAMTAVIQFTYQSHIDHLYWAVVLSGLLVHGAGKLSLDYLFSKRGRK